MPLQRQDSTNSEPIYCSRKTPFDTSFKRTSFRPFKLPASVTVEAALAIPLFLMAVLALLYLLEVMSIRTTVRSGMQYAAGNAAQELAVVPVCSVSGLEEDLVEAIGAARLERSIVEGGASGLQCEESKVSARTGILNMKVKYRVKLPLPAFAVPPVSMQESMRVKGWTGYVPVWDTGAGEETVYLTETGVVYHRDYHCAYLDLSVRSVPSDSVSGLRNQSGAAYHPCSYCVHGAVRGSVFVTDYGTHYHSLATCSRLKRTIYAVPLSEAVGKGACSKCCR